MKILITVKISDEQFKKIQDLGYDVVRISESKVTNSSETDDADILVCYNPFKTLDIEKMKNLKYIMLTSVGFDQLPKEKVLARNIKVTNNRGGYSIPMAEWIVMCILEIYKRAKMFYNQQQEKIWHMDLVSISELYGQRIGFLGTGTIAIEAAKRLQGFGGKDITPGKKLFVGFLIKPGAYHSLRKKNLQWNPVFFYCLNFYHSRPGMKSSTGA